MTDIKSPVRTRLYGSGYYADPGSPIASTPQRKAPRTPATPSMHALSPMHGPPSRVPARKGSFDDEDEALFSPPLKCVDDDSDSAGFTPAEEPTSSAMMSPAPDSRVDTLPHQQRTSQYTTTGTPTRVDSHADYASPAARAQREVHPSHTNTDTRIEYKYEVTTKNDAVVRQDLQTLSVEVEEESPEDDDVSEDEYEQFNPYLFIKLLPPYNAVSHLRVPVALPSKTCRADISLVLDLDETLVHCSIDPLPNADLTFPVTFNDVEYKVYVRKRPYLEKFLRRVSELFEVTVFTASQSVYASRLLDLLDPEHQFIHHRLYRESCLLVEGNYVKDLNVLGRDLKKTILVDNSPHAFAYQVDNGIPIEGWYDDRNDTELLKLASFLDTLKGSDDVRPLVRAKFQVRQLIKNAR